MLFSHPLYHTPSSVSRGHKPPARFSRQRTMYEHSSPFPESRSSAHQASRGGALRRGPFPTFLMDIAQSDDADRLLPNVDMLKDDALEAAEAAL